ncbi:3-deoxy-manno-octulosonate cytidylyltransferase [Megasphaera sp. BL7]|nr:3-deoxy-manno-octulosonate cytidylyltransferase [Megasphaera sp. BL7]
MIKTHHQFIGIDTPDDLEHIRRYFAESAHKGE